NIALILLAETDLPDDLAVLDLHANQVTTDPECVQHVAFHGGRATRAFVGTVICALRRDLLDPQFTAGLFVQRPNDFVVVAVTHAKDAAARDTRRAVAATEFLLLPNKVGAILRPGTE